LTKSAADDGLPIAPPTSVLAASLDAWLVTALPGAVAYATSLTGKRADGEDIVQDCLCRLLSHADRYDLPQDGRKLLFRSITNACLNLKRRRRAPLNLSELSKTDSDAPVDIADHAAPSPPQELLTDELRAAIAEGLDKLPLRHRATIELTSLGYKPREIAQMLEINADHVRVILARSRKALAAFLNSRFPE
jgi:RNA polymerase sigma-70 factor (ECF subfamily)